MASTNIGSITTVFILFAVFIISLLSEIHALAAPKKDSPDELKTGGLPAAGLCVDGKTASYEACKIDVGQLRGGDFDGIDDKTASLIHRFLEPSATKAADKFYIQGWRWHVMSLIRDAGRLERLAKYLSRKNDEANSPGFTALNEAAHYVVKFNMAGLYRIESTLFVKWLRDHLCNTQILEPFAGENSAHLSNAFKSAINKVDKYRIISEKTGNDLYERANRASNESTNPEQRKILLHEISQLSTKLSKQLNVLRNLQESLIVPSVARIVPSGEQKSFNNRVLLKLGLLESRVHLVGMHDAVWESGLEEEKEMFESDIPYVARMMIERWRKSLYLPKAAALDYGLD
mmetsp:Transcript_10404/g.21745  ORF Transcript_10404/g.21745 Transcript_10404/m.21745 type:complete len:346 (-) Transcript_10404:19-1056(-)